MHLPVVVAGGDVRAVSRPGHAFHQVVQAGGVTAIDQAGLPEASVPDLRGHIVAHRSNPPAIGRPGQVVDAPLMAAVERDGPAGESLPDTRDLVNTA